MQVFNHRSKQKLWQEDIKGKEFLFYFFGDSFFQLVWLGDEKLWHGLSWVQWQDVQLNFESFAVVWLHMMEV